MDHFLLSFLEVRELVSFVCCFDGNVDDVVGRCVGLLVGGIMADSDIYSMQFNESSHFPCKA